MTFKVRLLLGAATPFFLALPAVAQVSITTATTTPVQTSTANNGAASDVSITSTGSVTLTSAAANTAAVTIDSANTVANAGSIGTVNSNDTVGVRILPNLATSYSGAGSISMLEDYTRTDTDADDDLDGALATGSNRVGLLVESGGTLNGNITLNSGGSISVEGNNSAGVSIRSTLNGNYTQANAVSVVGSNGVGVEFRENVTGNVKLGGGISTTGEGSVAARVLGDVAGEFSIDGTILSTGFTSTSASNYEDPDLADDNNTGSDEPAALDPDDLLVGGSAVEIRGDLGLGFLINGAAVGGTDPTDDVKDVVQDFNENRTTGSVSSFGSAPAVLIQSLDGAAGDNIVLTRVRETVLDTLDDDDDDNLTEVIGTFNYDYGFMNRGAIFANGLNTGFASTGLKIAGSADGAYQTIIDGGVFNGSTIGAQAYEANAVGFQFGSGATTPLLVNNGSITASVATETNHTAIGVRVDAGANLPAVTNNGLLLASARGYDGNAIAFQDLSGTVTNFTNASRISAGFIDDDTDDDITSGTGNAIAVDLSYSASGVNFTQNDTVDNTRIFGDVLLGVGNDQVNLLSGEITGDVNFGTGSDTFTANSAKLTGAAIFGGSGATVAFNAAEMAGDLTLGNAAGSLDFINGSIFNGGITRTGAGAMTLNVNNSTLNNSADGTLNLTSMTLANNAKVGLVIDNARITGNTPIFNVAGTASVGANTLFTPIFDQFSNQAFTLRVLNAGTLSLGGSLDSMLNADSPYIYDMSLVQPTGVQGLDLVLRVKNATELGLNTRQADAYGAVLDLMEQQDEVGSAVTSIPGADEFLRGWNDLLPGSDAAVMRVLSSNSTAAFGATARRLDLVSNKPDAPGGAWAEEFGVHHTSDASERAIGVSGGGFGVAAGIDVLSTGTALIGAYAALESAELEEETRTGNPLNVAQTAVGAYAGWLNGNLAINGAASIGFVEFSSDRKVEVGSLSDRLKGDWKGQTYTAGARATYTLPMGWLDVKPYVAADYIGFTQDGYQETAATNEDLEIVAGDSDATLATASAGFSLIGNLGSDDAFSIKPELSVGYRSVLNWENTPAALRFAGNSTGTSFTLDPGVEPEDAIVAGLGLNIDSQFLNMKVGYDAEVSDTSITHYGSIALRMAFW
jgi:uncharacterized protein with beta-barrel porin domain